MTIYTTSAQTGRIFNDIVSARKFAIERLLSVPKSYGQIDIYKGSIKVEEIRKVFLRWNDTNTIMSFQIGKYIWKMLRSTGTLAEGYFEPTQKLVSIEGWRENTATYSKMVKSGPYSVWFNGPWRN